MDLFNMDSRLLGNDERIGAMLLWIPPRLRGHKLLNGNDDPQKRALEKLKQLYLEFFPTS